MAIQRKTKSVNLIISKFEMTTEALSGVDLVDQFKNVMNKTTVYRILERLETEGILHSFSGKNGSKWYAKQQLNNRYEPNNIHPYFECTACGKVECLAVNIPLPQLSNRHIDTADIIITGQCDNCIP